MILAIPSVSILLTIYTNCIKFLQYFYNIINGRESKRKRAKFINFLEILFRKRLFKKISTDCISIFMFILV